MQLDFIRRLRQMIVKEGYIVTGKKYKETEREIKNNSRLREEFEVKLEGREREADQKEADQCGPPSP